MQVYCISCIRDDIHGHVAGVDREGVTLTVSKDPRRYLLFDTEYFAKAFIEWLRWLVLDPENYDFWVASVMLEDFE